MNRTGSVAREHVDPTQPCGQPRGGGHIELGNRCGMPSSQPSPSTASACANPSARASSARNSNDQPAG
jgi:hypothetical protein